MPNNQISLEVDTSKPSYVSWRAQLLAELALVRVPSLRVHKRTDRTASDPPYDFLVAAEGGLFFYVEAKGFSSFRLKRKDIAAVREFHWTLDADVVRRVRAGERPFLLFLFDADREHGRYLRLDTLPEPGPKVESLQVCFPVENTITKESLTRVVRELEKARKP